MHRLKMQDLSMTHEEQSVMYCTCLALGELGAIGGLAAGLLITRLAAAVLSCDLPAETTRQAITIGCGAAGFVAASFAAGVALFKNTNSEKIERQEKLHQPYMFQIA